MNEIDVFAWFVVKLLFIMGGTGFVAMLVALGGLIFGAGFVLGGLIFGAGFVLGELKQRKERPKKPTKELQEYFAPKERPMEAQKLDHIKYDILPDGSLSPGDNRNLEGPE